MKVVRNMFLAGVLVGGLSFPLSALAAEQDLEKKVDALTKEVETLKRQAKKTEDKSLGQWLTIGGDYRFRVDSLIADVPAHSRAIGTMNNLVQGFTAPTGPMSVAGTTVGGVVNPSATQFIMMGKAGSLFTPQQFDTILNKYMVSAMYNSFFAPTGIAAQMAAMTPAQFMATQQATALTPQQSQILNTLKSKLMPQLMGMMTPAQQAMFGGMTPQQQQVAFQMMMQGFLGAGGGNLAQVGAYKPSNDTLYTNRFGLDLHAKATKNVTVNVRLLAYKAFGSNDDSQVTGSGGNPFFADRVGVFDGTLGHVASSDFLSVDRAYATWANIGDQPIWFSVGRRPSTNGVPEHLRLNNERPGNGGTPALLVDYAFDGMTVGWAPDIESLPGSYAKICYGRGFESGIDAPGSNNGNSVKDTDMLGVAVVPIDTDPLRVHVQWNRGFNIFDFPTMSNTFFGNTAPAVNLGDIDWYGAGVLSTLKKVGPGNLNMFADFGMSVTHPNDNVSANAGFQGLMTGQFFAQEAPSSKTGYAAYLGARYDYLPTNTKLGVEYNHGSKNWITFAPASDDMWTAKVGTRGNVYETYLIQDLNLKPVSSYLSKAFVKLGYQYYDFEYTGSNNWVGAPQKISDIKSTDMFLLTPVKSAQDIYFTFEVKF